MSATDAPVHSATRRRSTGKGSTTLSAIGVGMVLIGLPVYYVFRAINGKQQIPATESA
jgi:hypothetical protein